VTLSDQPLVTVFTPSHDPRFLDETLICLYAQDYPHWEWVVVLNDGARWQPLERDGRVRVETAYDVTGVGAAKRRACELAGGELLVELDHDDLLTPQALSAVVAEFQRHPDAGLVYSHTAQMLADGSPDRSRFDAAQGWEYRDVVIGEHTYISAVAMAPTPHNVSYIWYAPNHVRAFTRTAYDAVGGYAADRTVLDDQDLMCRLYGYGEFHLVDECLYLQRMHEANTQRNPETNAFIQRETVALYDRYFESNALAWARRRGLLALDMGAAHNRPPGYLGVDQHPGPNVDIVATLPAPLEVADNSVGVIRAVDFLEHVPDKVAVINELYRMLAPGGVLLSMTPSTDGRGAFQDPTHVAFYNENSFWYYTERNYRNFVPELEVMFQSSRMVTHFPTDWHEQHDISYVTANLIALKGDDCPRNGGVLHW
jgi:glycosyltransferase involved in cell wall biosynthesis/predicted SAM-dependent methyltransferase